MISIFLSFARWCGFIAKKQISENRNDQIVETNLILLLHTIVIDNFGQEMLGV